MALDWLPIDARPARPHRPLRGEILSPFTAKTIPVPDVLASLTFFPSLALPPRPHHLLLTSVVSPVWPAAAPLSWLPIDRRPTHLPFIRRSLLVDPPPGALIVIAQQLAWIGTSSRPTHHRPPTLPPLTVAPLILPATPGMCVMLSDTAGATPVVAEARGQIPVIDQPQLGSPTLLQKDLC